MRCYVDGCFEPAFEQRTLITVERRDPNGLLRNKLKIMTGWCEQHSWMERYYKNLEVYLREDPRNYDDN